MDPIKRQQIQVALQQLATAHIHLFHGRQFQYQESRVESVEVLETTSADESANVQIPHVSRSEVATASEIPDGHTLLVAPLRRDETGKLRLYLVTPRVLP
jgi:hypothetical protein